jgi:hypothetical protein
MAASLTGSVATGAFPFSEDTITGSVKETYHGSCGGYKAKKVNKGSFTGTITIA